MGSLRALAWGKEAIGVVLAVRDGTVLPNYSFDHAHTTNAEHAASRTLQQYYKTHDQCAIAHTGRYDLGLAFILLLLCLT